MNDATRQKPKIRSRLRQSLGRRYHIIKRHIKWRRSGTVLARQSAKALPHICFAHKTPLLRRLRDVDMRLQHNKIVNLKIAAPLTDGVTLRPGETFSYWRAIGNPTRRRGFTDGMVLNSGKYTEGVGGGLCQLSNLIYWMTLHTPLTVTERHRHSYDVFPDSNRTQPFGSGATCFYNYGDLVIRNDTQATYRLCIRVTEADLEGEWTCDTPPEVRYEVYEREHYMRQEFWGGYTRHNLLYRRVFSRDGVLLSDEYVTENHAIMMYAPFLPEARQNEV